MYRNEINCQHDKQIKIIAMARKWAEKQLKWEDQYNHVIRLRSKPNGMCVDCSIAQIE